MTSRRATSSAAEEEEEQPRLTSFMNTFDVFPRSATFEPTYPTVGPFSASWSSVHLPIRSELQSPSTTSSHSLSLTVSPGTVYTLVVTFLSATVGNFRCQVVISSNPHVITASLSAQCLPSPLIIKADDISDFVFSNGKKTLKSMIANRSLNRYSRSSLLG
jgi:hypothetical protein